ncbi:hypothetical protein M0804_003598 [Polistes exclamans]|nr:hypothetical protein M0804_003598 [Polistes exclamans]
MVRAGGTTNIGGKRRRGCVLAGCAAAAAAASQDCLQIPERSIVSPNVHCPPVTGKSTMPTSSRAITYLRAHVYRDTQGTLQLQSIQDILLFSL